MYYYLICKKKKFYAITGEVADFGATIANEDIIEFITKAMINNWQIELILENEMEKLEEKTRKQQEEWREYKKWMPV